MLQILLLYVLEDDYELTTPEKEMINNVSEVFHTRHIPDRPTFP
jgi:hypothetical protein